MGLEVELLDIDNPDHAGFFFDLGEACKADFLNDYDNDIILMMNQYKRRIEDGSVKAFVAKSQGQKVGIIWCELGDYGDGRVRAGLLPRYRCRGRLAWNIMKMFVDYCFNTLDLRKLDATIELYYRNANKSSYAAEKILRKLTFTKEGILRQAITRDGKPKDMILFGLLRDEYKRKLAHVV